MSHGKRYSASERKKILKFLDTHTYEETVNEYKVSQMTLARWVKRKKRRDNYPVGYTITPEQYGEVQPYLKILERLEEIKLAFLVDYSGQIMTTNSSLNKNKIDSRIHDERLIIPQVLKLLYNNDIFCRDFFNNIQEKKIPQNKHALINDMMINSNYGVLFLLGIGGKVTIILVSEKKSNVHDLITMHYSYVMKIIKGLQSLL